MRVRFILRSGLGATIWGCAMVLSCSVSAQQVPTPGTVQEPLRERPALPPTPREAPIAEPAVPAAPVEPGGPRIPIQRFEVSGNEVISTDELRRILAPYEGRSLTLFEIYDVADVLTRYYREQGYSVASVAVPEQKVSSGIVRLEVIEGRIGAVGVAGNERYRSKLIEGYLDDIAIGEVIQRSVLEQELLLLNDLPGLRARAVVQPGEQYGESKLVVQTEEDLVDYAARLNNYGRTSIGEWRLEGDLGINAPFGWGERIDLNAVWAEGNNLNYLSARYSVPVLYEGTRAAVYYSSYNYEVNNADLAPGLQGLDISGDGDNFGTNVFHPLIRSRKQNLFVGVGYDRTITRQLTQGLGIKEKADISLLVLSGLYSMIHADNSITSVSTVFSTNFDSNDRNPATHPTKPGRPENNAQTAKLQVDASHYRPLGGRWAVQVRGTAVGSLDPLVDTERFRIGGRDSVRAFASSELAGDGGYALSLELFRHFAIMPYLPASASVFVDTGTVTRKNAATIGQESSESISGAGLGFTALLMGRYKLDLEFAHQIGSQEATDGRDDIRVWGGVSANF